MTDKKDYWLITLMESLGPCTIVDSEEEANSIIGFLAKTNKLKTIHVIEHQAYQELQEQNTKLKAALEVTMEGLKAEWPGLYGKTVNELNKEYLSKIEELLK